MVSPGTEPAVGVPAAGASREVQDRHGRVPRVRSWKRRGRGRIRRPCLRRHRLHTRKLLLATGVVDDLPRLAGLEPLYGTSVHHCPYCDGWEWRDRPLAAYGEGEAACGLALSLTFWSCDVLLCTGGSDLPDGAAASLDAAGVKLRQEPVLRLEGKEGRLEPSFSPAARRSRARCSSSPGSGSGAPLPSGSGASSRPGAAWIRGPAR